MNKRQKVKEYINTWLATIIVGQIWKNKAVPFTDDNNREAWQVRVVDVSNGRITYEMVNGNQVTTKIINFRKEYAWHANNQNDVTQDIRMFAT